MRRERRVHSGDYITIRGNSSPTPRGVTGLIGPSHTSAEGNTTTYNDSMVDSDSSGP